MSDKQEVTKPHDLPENACVVCFKQCLIYSIGSCNHEVCYECSARMRCLCLQNECPICRADLPKVIFTKTVAPFATLDRELRSGLYEKKYRIVFADLEIQKSFYHLLENRCPECDHTPFLEFNKLKDHVRKVHELFYCEICTDNLKIFSSERRCYSRSHLAQHRRVGDPDDRSHKGHPRCEYCELRFLDKDELYKHLRREHYFCHFCDADGTNLFFGAINEMRDHFKSEHFLCEEDECANEQFTAVFRSEIDLKAHVAHTHLKGMSKSENKQARTLDLEFSYGPRGNARGGGQDGGRSHRSRMNDPQREFDRIPEPTVVQQPPIKIDSKNEEQFPSLGGPSNSAGPQVQLANTVRHISYGTSGLARTKENFPSLGGTPTNEKTNQPVVNQKPSGKQPKVPTASSMLKGSSSKANNRPTKSLSASLKKDSSDFPALSQNNSSSIAASSMFKAPPPTFTRPVTANRPTTSATSSASLKKNSDFPALSQNNTKKGRRNEQLLEDMILPESSVNMNLVSSKHRNLVEDYVSMASRVSKVQTVQQKDIEVPQEIVKKNVPKLNSNDNFPTLGGDGAGASNTPQWFTVKNNPKQQAKQESKEFTINTKKVNPMPDLSAKNAAKPAKLQNGVNKLSEMKKPNNGNAKEKPKPQNNNKENKNENVLVENNFPSLGSDLTPPPGFLNNPKLSKKPPPGFNSSPESSTNSDNSTVFSYLPPPNMSKRNQAIVSEFQKSLKTPESMQEFRQVSQMFRDGNYFAKSYYETCKVVLGAGFDSIFPELLALLPDIEKQQSLYAVYLEELRDAESSGSKSKKKNKKLEVCATCNQVLLSTDLLTHVQSHALENNFPSLNLPQEAPTTKQWKK